MLIRAVEHGDVNSMLSLGYIYFNGHGVEKDVARARELLLTAAAQGDIGSIGILQMLDSSEGKSTPSYVATPTFCTYCK